MLLYCMYFIGYPVVNDPLYNHEVFGPEKGKYGNIGKTDEQLIQDLISIHNAENWLGMDIESEGGNVLSAGVQERHDGFSTENDKAQRVEASSTTKSSSTIMDFNVDTKEVSPGPIEVKTSSSNTISTSVNSETNLNNMKGNRSETPDSAVDVNSLPASADSPSSSSSTTSCYSSNLQFQNNQNSTSTSTSIGLQASLPTTLENIANNEVARNNIPSATTTTCSISYNLVNCMNSTLNSRSTLSPNSSSSDQRESQNSIRGCVTTIATQTGIEEADERFNIKKLSFDTHCYECKVKYRDPSPNDLVMFLHAYTYTVKLYIFLLSFR